MIDGGDPSVFTLGEDEDRVTIRVRPMQVDMIPAFTRAVQPLVGVISGLLGGESLRIAEISAFVQENFDEVKSLLAVATTRVERGDTEDKLAAKIDARKQEIGLSSIDQALSLLLGVIQANKDFLSGRLMQALRTAAALRNGAGLTPSSPSLPQDSTATQ